MPQAKLFFRPYIWITAEHAADVLGCSIEKASQILSRPDTNDVLKAAMNQALQESLANTLRQMVRIPHEAVPTRIDCAVALPELPIARVFSQE